MAFRNSDWETWVSWWNCRDRTLDGEDRVRHQQGNCCWRRLFRSVKLPRR